MGSIVDVVEIVELGGFKLRYSVSFVEVLKDFNMLFVLFFFVLSLRENEVG